VSSDIGYSCRCSEAEFCALQCVIVVNELPNGTNVVGQLFRERERFAHQTATALALENNRRGQAYYSSRLSFPLPAYKGRVRHPDAYRCLVLGTSGGRGKMRNLFNCPIVIWVALSVWFIQSYAECWTVLTVWDTKKAAPDYSSTALKATKKPVQDEPFCCKIYLQEVGTPWNLETL